ncbi:DUF1350 family protein [Cyanobium sp. Morenito 9A2]|uniref:DUF1350 family protein n=1 Tax=Cyanobium sp. Morenito 9A2 TaxID=2823718 RepID=UPI0020CE7578|nr:DUF1350 family protein [Cyanobium sp. Morenito 9A2]MCP9849459.1 DUF1350 family protein [Cyanobium sp. Morenito 9A2]
MSDWHQQGPLWCLTPREPIGLVEFIGGTGLALTPQLSYRRLLEALVRQGAQVRAWGYVPGFDHQAQANEAWRAFRKAREKRPSGGALEPLRLGHSLGCKLHLLAPDGGRGSAALAALCFNNFAAASSIPLLGELAPRLGLSSEFSPSPAETLRLIASGYGQRRNLLVRFSRDGIDQSEELLSVLRQRPNDRSELLELQGDHLTPASAGVRQNLLGNWADDPARVRQMRQLCGALMGWWQNPVDAERRNDYNKYPENG